MSDEGMPWLFLSIFLLLLLFMLILAYSAAITNSISPSRCPNSYGDYGVEPGVSGSHLGDKYIYEVDGLLSATDKCDSDDLCTSFYYSSGQMIYLTEDTGRISSPAGGVYKRQINLDK